MTNCHLNFSFTSKKSSTVKVAILNRYRCRTVLYRTVPFRYRYRDQIVNLIMFCVFVLFKYFVKKNYFLIYFRLKCGNGTIKTRKLNVPHGIIF
jgi:hypothetical protein